MTIIGQVIPMLDYDIGVKMGTQAPYEQTGQTGVAFNKGFMYAETLVYFPLLLAGLFLDLTGERYLAVLCMSGVFAITVYWSFIFTLVLKEEDFPLSQEDKEQISPRLDMLSIIGLICFYMTIFGKNTVEKEPGKRTINSKKTNRLRNLFLQTTSWMFVSVLFVGQVLPIIDYEIGVKMGTQEPVEQVGKTGVVFNKGFIFADSVFYVPLFLVGLFLYTYRSDLSKPCLAGAYAITVYWSLVCPTVLKEADYQLPPQKQDQWMTVLPIVSVWGFVCFLFVALDNDHVKNSKKIRDNISNGTYFSGILSAYLYLLSDLCMLVIHRDNFDWKSTSISDLVAIQDKYQIVPITLLSISNGCLFMFGLGLYLNKDHFLGLCQMSVGVSNTFSVAVFRLDDPIIEGSTASLASKALSIEDIVHLLFVFVSLLFTILALHRSTKIMVDTTQFFYMVKVCLFFITVGILGSIMQPHLVGIFERISVYAIQFWIILLVYEVWVR
ncbi:hypothetical protein CTEN210_01819 [Chaetoceros tenuissimus]|uniref:Uncharacterized protein n=1 Tax=Chaetoceros tenuissimus TaxID=426638 RepID=A0AAD3CIP0_9STRA|nr:hypothetical protein CTEN210_01819 [Chaetoceros tenuissimus]